jgi:hypothetical protein
VRTRHLPSAPGGLPSDPFRALGLRRSADMTDDEVRAAWRRKAAGTHPDRADGGDPAEFAAAAVAYTKLRTPAARAEALAGDVQSTPPHGFRRGWLPVPAAALAARIWRGRRSLLAARVLAAVAAGIAAVATAGWQPASAAVITGALTWLILTGRADLAPPVSRRTPVRHWPSVGRAGEHDVR